MKRGFYLLVLVLAATLARGAMVVDSYRFATSQRIAYIGNSVDSTTGAVLGSYVASSPTGNDYSTDFYGAVAFYGSPAISPSSVKGNQEFICPGTGPQTVGSIEFFGYQRGGGTVRVEIFEYAEQSDDGGTIYNYQLNYVCGHSGAVTLSGGSTTPAWVGVSQGLSGTTTLTGGKRYIVACAMNSGAAGYAYTSSSNAVSNLSGDYSAGLPNPLTGGGINNSAAPIFRIKITGNGTATPAATREQFYVNTDFSGTSTGSLTNPYKKGQDVLVARCNKTFTLPIYVNLSGATDDVTAIDDSALGQFVPTSSNQLYFIGDRTSATWDNSAYTLAPSNRTSYYGVLNLHQPYVNFDRIQYDLPSLTAGQNNEVLYVTHGVFSNSIIHAPAGTETTRYLSSVNDLGNPVNGVKLINILAYGMSTGGTQGNGLKLHGRVYVYDSTIIAGSGINGIDVASDGNVDVVNTYVYAGLTNLDSVGTMTVTTSATSDSTGTSGYRNIPVNSTTFSNPGSNDYRLGSGSALRGANGGVGTDISGTESRTATDLIGATRSAPWDIGALKY